MFSLMKNQICFETLYLTKSKTPDVIAHGWSTIAYLLTIAYDFNSTGQD